MNKKNQERLIKHYNRKYRYEPSNIAQDTSVSTRKWPADRYEAMAFWSGSGTSLLEVGAGDGRVISAVRNNFKLIVGIEFSSERIKLLFEKFKNDKHIIIEQKDIEEFPEFISAPFDTIIMNAIIEHLVDPIGTMSYIHSLLKPGGTVIITTPNIAKWTRRIKLLFGHFPSTASLDEGFLQCDRINKTDLHDEGHLHYFTYRALRKLLIERCGFAYVKEYGFGKYGRIHQYLKNLLSDCCVIAVKL